MSSTAASPSLLVADAHLQREGGLDRKTVDVAVGILINDQQQFLLTSRPPGKVYEGYWEFPGGKLEANETVAQALTRELEEEIGLKIEVVQMWRQQLVDYPHALVRLNFCKVTRWQGDMQMREGQNFAWQNLPVKVVPVVQEQVASYQVWTQENAQRIEQYNAWAEQRQPYSQRVRQWREAK